MSKRGGAKKRKDDEGDVRRSERSRRAPKRFKFEEEQKRKRRINSDESESEEEWEEEPPKKKKKATAGRGRGRPRTKKASEEEGSEKEEKDEKENGKDDGDKEEKKETKPKAKRVLDNLKSKTNVQLKEMLGHNEQIQQGNKADLVKRIRDCRKNGCLPRCPKCGVGRLKKKGQQYVCPGGMEDEHFIKCSYTAKNVERPAWEELTEKEEEKAEEEKANEENADAEEEKAEEEEGKEK